MLLLPPPATRLPCGAPDTSELTPPSSGPATPLAIPPPPEPNIGCPTRLLLLPIELHEGPLPSELAPENAPELPLTEPSELAEDKPLDPTEAGIIRLSTSSLIRSAERSAPANGRPLEDGAIDAEPRSSCI